MTEIGSKSWLWSLYAVFVLVFLIRLFARWRSRRRHRPYRGPGSTPLQDLCSRCAKPAREFIGRADYCAGLWVCMKCAQDLGFDFKPTRFHQATPESTKSGVDRPLSLEHLDEVQLRAKSEFTPPAQPYRGELIKEGPPSAQAFRGDQIDLATDEW